MKLNKKGFTLMELLAVIVILAIIFAVAIPSISSSVERSKTKQLNAKIEVIKAASELYNDTYGKNSYIPLGELVCKKLLTKEEIKDPFDDNSSLCGFVYLEDSEYKWKDTSGTRENCIDLSNDADIDCDNYKFEPLDGDVVTINGNRCYRNGGVSILYYITECNSNICRYSKKNNNVEFGAVERNNLTLSTVNCG